MPDQWYTRSMITFLKNRHFLLVFCELRFHFILPRSTEIILAKTLVVVIHQVSLIFMTTFGILQLTLNPDELKQRLLSLNSSLTEEVIDEFLQSSFRSNIVGSLLCISFAIQRITSLGYDETLKVKNIAINLYSQLNNICMCGIVYSCYDVVLLSLYGSNALHFSSCPSWRRWRILKISCATILG